MVVGAALALGLGVATPVRAVAASDHSVAQAEKRLNRLHCDAGRADGRADRHTRSAVLRFQSRVHVRTTGRLNGPTMRRLFADGAPRCDRRPVPRGSGHGRRIVVSQGQNWVWLVGPRGRVVAQGGMVDNTRVLHRGAHVTGSYCGRAARIHRNQDYSGRLWLDDFVRFAPCGIGFHRIPRHRSNGHQIHPDWILGTDLDRSHGCIRLSRELADRVWTFTARRTPVRVV
jgi:peptidoglycan hydrolase-like protein with peptidoglycan-binding domain